MDESTTFRVLVRNSGTTYFDEKSKVFTDEDNAHEYGKQLLQERCCRVVQYKLKRTRKDIVYESDSSGVWNPHKIRLETKMMNSEGSRPPRRTFENKE